MFKWLTAVLYQHDRIAIVLDEAITKALTLALILGPALALVATNALWLSAATPGKSGT